MKNRVIKIISNQYTILKADGTIEKAIASGKMRLKDKIVVGDFVEIEYNEGICTIVDLGERQNILKRPYLANVDQAYIVMSLKDPEFSFELVNRLLLMIEYAHIKPIIIATKSDLATNEEIEAVSNYYASMDYKVIIVNKFEDSKVLLDSLKNNISVLCGQSGVGKSSILNRIDDSLNLATNEISKALNRGKHTTRHVELYPIEGGYLADTPGFSSIDLYDIEIDELQKRISVFQNHEACRFLDCRHLNEPDCAIKEAVSNGHIQETFYKTYCDIVKMIQDGNVKANNHRKLK